jgi:uncharacterized protein (DUF433 family)
MKTAVALPPYIEVDERGVAYIAGTRLKVADLVMARAAQGWDADELAEQFPAASLAEVHAAFVYYYSDREQVDAHIAEAEAVYEDGLAAQEDTPFIQRLRGLKQAR